MCSSIINLSSTLGGDASFVPWRYTNGSKKREKKPHTVKKSIVVYEPVFIVQPKAAKVNRRPNFRTDTVEGARSGGGGTKHFPKLNFGSIVSWLSGRSRVPPSPPPTARVVRTFIRNAFRVRRLRLWKAPGEARRLPRIFFSEGGEKAEKQEQDFREK